MDIFSDTTYVKKLNEKLKQGRVISFVTDTVWGVLLPYVKDIPCKAHELMEKYFPGALTLIFEKSDKTPDYVTSFKNTVGIRVPDNPFFKSLCEVIDGHVLATTSANLSGQSAASSYEEAVQNVGAHVEYVFEDYGFKAQGLASTVALAVSDDIKVLRQGEVLIK